MTLHHPVPSLLISARTYAFILSRPRLRRRLVPEGLVVNTYRVLDYRGALVLDDEYGTRATFRRTQRIRVGVQVLPPAPGEIRTDLAPPIDYRYSSGRFARVLG